MSQRKLSATLRVFDSVGLLRTIPASEAPALLASGAEPIGNRRTIYGLRIAAKRAPDLPTGTPGSPASLAGQRYSHCRESRTNPPRVWTLRDVAHRDRALFLLSVTDNLVVGA